MQLPEFDPKNLIELLFQGLAIFIFIGLPILRSIRESRRRAAQGGEPKVGAEELDREKAAREQWERMLRGETREAPVELPPVPPAIPPPPRGELEPPPAQPLAPRWSAPRSGQRAAPGERQAASPEGVPESERLGPLAPVSEAEVAPERSSESDVQGDFALDEEKLAEEAIAARARAEREERVEHVRAERQAASGLRAAVAPVAVHAFEAPPARAPRAAVFALGVPGVDRRAAWRRAILVAEVLGPPVAVRDPAAPTSAAAFRG